MVTDYGVVAESEEVETVELMDVTPCLSQTAEIVTDHEIVDRTEGKCEGKLKFAICTRKFSLADLPHLVLLKLLLGNHMINVICITLLYVGVSIISLFVHIFCGIYNIYQILYKRCGDDI